jgi:hypothetical protein
VQALRPFVIVQPGAGELQSWLAERLAGKAVVFADRRRAERRQEELPGSPDRRQAERRRLLPPRFGGWRRDLGYQMLFGADAFRRPPVPDYAFSFCGDCQRPLDFSMPRFVEPPARVDMQARHLLAGAEVRHVVDLEASLASGQTLLAASVDARLCD